MADQPTHRLAQLSDLHLTAPIMPLAGHQNRGIAR